MIHLFGARWLAGVGLAAAAFIWSAGSVSAQENCGDCFSCPKFHCPPALRHCLEGAPRIHFRRGCPKPICNPCTAPNWGYYQTCWTPWPWPQDWNHCPVQPPAAVVQPGLMLPTTGPATVDESLPVPRRTKSGI